jgi:hypothetical protein
VSNYASTWAWKQNLSGTGKGNPGRKLLLMAIADNADDHGVAWPGQKLLSAKSELKVRAVRDNLVWLEQNGLVLRVPQFREDGSRKSDLYVLAPTGDRGPMESVDRDHKLWPNIKDAWDPPAADAGGAAADAPSPRQPGAGGPGSPVPGTEPSGNRKKHQKEEESARERIPAEVLGPLTKVAASKPCERASPVAVLKAIEDYGEVDHTAVAGDLEFWALHGNGKRRKIKSLAGTWRTFLRRAEEDRLEREAKRPGSSVQSGGVQTDDGWNDETIRYD